MFGAVLAPARSRGYHVGRFFVRTRVMSLKRFSRDSRRRARQTGPRIAGPRIAESRSGSPGSEMLATSQAHRSHRGEATVRRMPPPRERCSLSSLSRRLILRGWCGVIFGAILAPARSRGYHVGRFFVRNTHGVLSFTNSRDAVARRKSECRLRQKGIRRPLLSMW